MLFNSLSFIGFFAAVAVVFYTTAPRFRWILLLLASIYFYSTFDPRYLLLLLFATVVAYASTLLIDGSSNARLRRWLMTVGVLLELSVLLLFKYTDFILASIEPVAAGLGLLSEATALPRLEFLLPVGLSFFTFSCVSYIVDVYKGVQPAERHFGRAALYVSFFPKLLAGPIERAKPFLEQIRTPRAFSAAGIAAGLQLMLWGLFKKVVIADRLAPIVDNAFAMPAFQSPVALLVAVYLYAFQIYCDFSGYSDIAIGAAGVLGIRLMDNFRRPYFSTSIPEFWSKRWHISLATWFRDYMYIPLGGNRVSRPRLYFNLLAVFLVSGLWHGAAWTFVIWGGLNGLYQIIYLWLARVRVKFVEIVRLPQRLADILNMIIVFHLVTIAWVFFRANTLADASTILSRIWAAFPQLPSLVRNYNWTGELILAGVLIVALLVIEAIDETRPIHERLAGKPTAVRWAYHYSLIFALIVLGAWGLNDFVYMQF